MALEFAQRSRSYGTSCDWCRRLDLWSCMMWAHLSTHPPDMESENSTSERTSICGRWLYIYTVIYTPILGLHARFGWRDGAPVVTPQHPDLGKRLVDVQRSFGSVFDHARMVFVHISLERRKVNMMKHCERWWNNENNWVVSLGGQTPMIEWFNMI